MYIAIHPDVPSYTWPARTPDHSLKHKTRTFIRYQYECLRNQQTSRMPRLGSETYTLVATATRHSDTPILRHIFALHHLYSGQELSCSNRRKPNQCKFNHECGKIRLVNLLLAWYDLLPKPPKPKALSGWLVLWRNIPEEACNKDVYTSVAPI